MINSTNQTNKHRNLKYIDTINSQRKSINSHYHNNNNVNLNTISVQYSNNNNHLNNLNKSLQVNQTISAARKHQKALHQKQKEKQRQSQNDFTNIINASIQASNHQHKNMFKRKLKKPQQFIRSSNQNSKISKDKDSNTTHVNSILISKNKKSQSISFRYQTNTKSPYAQLNSYNGNSNSARQSSLSIHKKSIQINLSNKLSPHHFTIIPNSALGTYKSVDINQRQKSNKRRSSLLQNNKVISLDHIKQLYKNNDFEESINLLKKFENVLQPNAEVLYYLGMSYININQFTIGVDKLLESIKVQPTFKRSLYLALALAFKRLNRIEDAINILTHCLKYFPQYYDALIYKGKMLYKQGQFLQAKQDFSRAIFFNDEKGFGYLGKGNAQIQLGQYKQAIQTFSQGIYTPTKINCYQKRALCYFQLKNYTQALKDIQKYSQLDKQKLWDYFKGVCYFKLNKKQDALMSLQLCLQNDTISQQITYAAQVMIKIKINDKDYYEAFHLVYRALQMNIILQDLLYWKDFLDGALSMMKKKIKEGIQILNKLLQKPLFKQKSYKQLTLQKQIQRYYFMKPLIYLFKGFGQLSLNNKCQAKRDYEQYQKTIKEIKAEDNNISKKYNMLIIKASQSFPKQCRKYLQQAKQLLPMKSQPYLLIGLQIVNNKLQNFQSKELQKKQKNDIIEQVLDNFTKGIQSLPQLSNNHISCFYYYRAIIHLYNQDFTQAVKDIDKAIEKSQDNIPKYFYLRGSIFSIFGNFPQAIQDYSVAINLQQKYQKPYLQRAKCLQIQGNSNQAFLDLQKYITLAPQDPNIHKYAGIFLFQNCSYEDCLAAFKHGPPSQTHYDSQITLTKAKCHFLLAQYTTSLHYFDNYQTQSFSGQYIVDTIAIQVCSKIKQGVTQQQLTNFKNSMKKLQQGGAYKQGKIFKEKDMTQIRGSLDLLLQQYQSALSWFFASLSSLQQQKAKQKQKNFIDSQNEQFEQEQSELQIKYNIILCYLCLSMYDQADQRMKQIQKNNEKGKDWELFLSLIKWLNQKDFDRQQTIALQTFEQNHRISKLWPKIKLPNSKIFLPMAFSFPFVQPPQLIPQFVEDFWQQFQMSKIQNKPQAPWINRYEGGLMFTPDLHNYENLQLSRTTTNHNQQSSQKNKPNTHHQYTFHESQQFIYQPDALKKKFKLDSATQLKLQKLLQKQKQKQNK